MDIRKTIAALSRMTVQNGATENEEIVAKKKIKILQEKLDKGETITRVELEIKIKRAQEEARKKKDEWKAELMKNHKEAAAEAVEWWHNIMDVDGTMEELEKFNAGIHTTYMAHRIFRK